MVKIFLFFSDFGGGYLRVWYKKGSPRRSEEIFGHRALGDLSRSTTLNVKKLRYGVQAGLEFEVVVEIENAGRGVPPQVGHVNGRRDEITDPRRH